MASRAAPSPAQPPSQENAPSLSDLVRQSQAQEGAHPPASLHAEFKKLKLSKTSPQALEEAAAALHVETPEGCFKNTVALANLLNALPLTENGPQVQRLAGFILHCSAERTIDCDDAFEGLCRKLSTFCVEQGIQICVSMARVFLVAVEKRVLNDWTALSPVHTDLMQVLVAGKLFGMATKVADTDPIRLCRRSESSAAEKQAIALDAQRFFYYAGIAYAAMHDYASASRALLTGLSLPALAFGAVHQAAYKKLALVSLLHRGKVVDPLPAYLSHIVSKHIENLLQQRSGELYPYTQLAAAFEDANTEATTVVNLANNPQFAEDGNAGLVEAVVSAFRRKQVTHLTSVYLTLSLDRIRISANVPDVQAAERRVLDMIRLGQVNAVIDQRLGVVHFLSASSVRNVDDELSKLTAFGALLAQADDRLAMKKSYIQKLVQRSTAVPATIDDAEAMDIVG